MHKRSRHIFLASNFYAIALIDKLRLKASSGLPKIALVQYNIES
ncbi:hypothetical protein [Nostoc sp. LPT]|nr:hypothetical protein [Nostoc sp. LPT]